ncbi:HAD-IA family hydrolase [Umezawaea tangerina]|uniref:Sugar-phosphatase n=1 Tax=Umezawaea tangerina TaxID=84725 RepID=A0A2T0T457_9PSEU|nr:HAD-IA family hydrolase [Umezawaea tangerina]PRY40413.1 sugar-phosphatase [Umezawaea tangerina]
MPEHTDIACLAVLFDCDGVLVDSTADGEAAWRRWAGEYGVDEHRVLDGLHGRRSPDTVALFLPEHLRAEALARIETIEIAGATGTKPIAGAADLLASLPDNWAVVTSASPALLHARITAAGLPVPPVVITGTDVGRGKPAPDGYLEAARRLGIPITECVVVEDSVAGVQAGLEAKALHVLGVGSGHATFRADSVVEDLADVTWTGKALRIPA